MSEPIEDKRGLVRAMQVIAHDNGGFRVTSASGNGEYMVRVGEPQLPLGACDCTDFKVRVKSKLDKGIMPSNLTCKHTREVWRHMYRRIHHIPFPK